MGTIVQADSLDHLFTLAKKMHRQVLNDKKIKRVVTAIKIDDRRAKKSTISFMYPFLKVLIYSSIG